MDERSAGAAAGDALAELVISRVETYLRDLDGARGLPLHGMIVAAVERPLLDWAMRRCGGSRLAAARLLGINRNTLRKKLLEQGLLRRDS